MNRNLPTVGKRIPQTKRTLLSILLATALFWVACNEDNSNPVAPKPKHPTPTPTLTPINLVANSSFEDTTGPSLAGWIIYDPYNAEVTPVQDAPTNGGKWSLQINSGLYDYYSAFAVAQPAFGKHRYRFSFWGKQSGNVYGSAYFWFWHSDSLYSLQSVDVAAYEWKYYSVLDTLNAGIGDSLVFSITGNYCTPIGPFIFTGETRFDECRIEQLD